MDSTLVLAYHRIADLPEDPLGMVVSPRHFEQHLVELDAMADVVPLGVVRQRGRGLRVAITFDDGYADNGELAAPLLERFHFPATFFVASNALDHDEFWWDRLRHVLEGDAHGSDAVELTIDSKRVRIDIRSEQGRARAFRALTRRLRVRPPSEIQAAMTELASQLEPAPPPCSDHRTLDGPSLAQLSRSELFDVGGHTRSHAMLAALDRDEQGAEVGGGRSRLVREVGAAVTAFAYPFGMAGSYTPETVQVVEEAGFDLAFTNMVGRVSPRVSRWEIPRCAVADCDGANFAARLRTWCTR